MNSQKQKLELLGNAPIPKALLAMGIPTMIGMLINALYNLVDAYFVGGLGESQMGAISIVYPLGQVVVGLGLLFGNGAASYISRLLGQVGTSRPPIIFNNVDLPLPEVPTMATNSPFSTERFTPSNAFVIFGSFP